MTTTTKELTRPDLTVLGQLTADPATFRIAPPAEPVVYRSGEDFTRLFGFRGLDAVLASGARRRPDFRVIRDGSPLPDARYTRRTMMHPDVPDVRRINAELAAGATLVMQGLQDYAETVGRFSRALAHDLSRPVHVNAYVTPPKSQGFGSHFDPRDAFIVQVEGTKTWTLRPPVFDGTLAHESWEKLRENPEWTTERLDQPEPWRVVTLEPGDSLWLPRGWVHSARSEGVSSLHLTFSMTVWSEHWAMQQVMFRVMDAPGRTELPSDFIRDRDAALGAVAAFRAGLSTWLDKIDDAELVELLQSAAIREFAAPARQVSSVLAADAVTPHTRFRVVRSAVLRAVERDGRLFVQLPDRRMVLPAGAGPVLIDLLARGSFTVDEVPGGVEVVRQMWREGLLETEGNDR